MTNPYEGDLSVSSLLPAFNPKPYNFEIKDYDQVKNLLHCSIPVGTPVLKCPDFHVQLDHTIAVIWLFYSDQLNWKKLATSHLEWAIRFVDGVISLAEAGEHGYVQLMKKHLEELLIVSYAEVDVNKFSGESGRITAMPVIEQMSIDKFDTEKILKTVSLPLASSGKGPTDENEMLQQLSNELEYIKSYRAKIQKRLKNANKVEHLIRDIKSQAADIEKLQQHLVTIKDTTNLFL